MDSGHSDKLSAYGVANPESRPGPAKPGKANRDEIAGLMAEIEQARRQADATWQAILERLSLDRFRHLAKARLTELRPAESGKGADDSRLAHDLGLALAASTRNNRLAPLLMIAGLSWFAARNILKISRDEPARQWPEIVQTGMLESLPDDPVAYRRAADMLEERATEAIGGGVPAAGQHAQAQVEPLLAAGAIFAIGALIGLIVPDGGRHRVYP